MILSEIRNVLTMAGFILFFPAQFIYSYLFAKGSIDFSFPFSLVVFIFTVASITIAILETIMNDRFVTTCTYRSWPALFILVYLFIYIFADSFSGNAIVDSWNRSSTLFNLLIVIMYCCMYIIGYYLNITNGTFKYIMLLFFVSMILMVFLNISPIEGMLSLDYMTENKRGIYLFLGDAFAIVAIVIISCISTKNRLLEIGVILISIYVLFLLRSRTSFYLFIATSVFYAFFRYGKKVLIVVMIIFACFFSIIDDVVKISPASMRMLSFIVEKEDASWSSRNEILAEGVKSISKNWVWGDFAGQVRETGSLGSYIHNYLSLWRQFGVFPFVAFLLLNLYCLRSFYIICKYRKNKNLSEDVYVTGLFFCCLYCFLSGEVVFSRAYVSPYIWLAFGYNMKVSRIFSREQGCKKLS